MLLVVLGISTPAFAEQTDVRDPAEEDSSEESPRDPSGTDMAAFPGIDYPSLQTLDLGRTLYLDHTYEQSNDLSTFAWVRGHGSNDRVALGGTLRMGGLHLAAELPLQYTRLHIDTLQGQPTAEQDREKVSFSLGDIILGVTYLWQLRSQGTTFHGGFDLRTRLPTHTTKYTFLLASGYGYEFGFPYYLHVAPGLVLALSSRYLSITINQAVLGMLARDVSVSGIQQKVPNIFFWESHYAVAVVPTEWLALSLELVSCIQLNRVDDAGFTTLHNVKALDLNPAVTVSFERYRLALVIRMGLTRGSQDFGAITFSGTHAALVRLSYVF